MESLVSDIKIEIFTLLDLADVKNLIQTSTVFHKIFISSKDFIIQQAIKNRLDPKSSREILAIAHCLHVKAWGRKAVLGILDIYFNRQPTIKSVNWDMSTALHINHLQTLVQDFTTEFASIALTRIYGTAYKASQHGPTNSELQRFEHTFWRFELYCNIFRDRTPRGTRAVPDRFSPKEQKSLFLDHFAAFENEQLGCVYDYLWDQVSVAFNDVAAHDVLWGAEWFVGWIGDCYSRESQHKEALLSRGLAQIMLMKSARTYDERYHLVQGETPYPDFDNDFLVASMSYAHMDDNGRDEELELLSLEQVRESSIAPLSPEPDDGPIEVWKWAYEQFYANCYFFPDNWFFRQRAYVMWDKGRLALYELYKNRRADIPEGFSSAYHLSMAAYEEQMQTFDARSKIYMKGGLGWWSPDDLSRIEWPEDRRKKKAISGKLLQSSNSNCYR